MKKNQSVSSSWWLSEDLQKKEIEFRERELQRVLPALFL